MAIDEQRLRVRRSLEEKLGVEEASYLMDRPAGGWSELVTNRTLDLKFDVLDERFKAIDERFVTMDAKFEARFAKMEDTLEMSIASLRYEFVAELDQRFADLAWRVITAVIAGMAVMAAVFAGVTAGLIAIIGS